MKMHGFRVEVVYPNEETTCEQNFTDYKLAYDYYQRMIKECSNDGYEYDYITIYSICGDVDDIDELDITDHYYTAGSHYFSKENDQ